MKRLLIASVATIGMTILGIGAAQAGDYGCGAPVASAPAPSGTVAQGQAAAGYRTYSYQPGYQSNSYQPAYRSSSRSQAGGFHDAGWKIRGGN
jgi:hypothetical protein